MFTSQTRAQISFEYLVIVGLALLLLVPALAFFFQSSGSVSSSAIDVQVQEIGLEMAAKAASAYALGSSAWLTLDISVPAAVEGFYLTNTGSAGNELIIRYYSQYGEADALFFPIVPITNATDTIGTPGEHLIAQARPGIMTFRFVSQGQNISIRLAPDGS